MRMAIGRISDGEIEFAQRICQFVRQIHRELMLVVPKMDDSYDMKSKMEVMLQSVIKIENGNAQKFHMFWVLFRLLCHRFCNPFGLVLFV